MNVARVVVYRLQLRSGWFRFRLPIAPFAWVDDPAARVFPSFGGNGGDASASGVRSLLWFGRHRFDVESPPDWLRNPFNGERVTDNRMHWSCVAEFKSGVGDIKTVWELSRFDWLLEALAEGRSTGGTTIPVEAWLRDWCRENPVNAGVQWKCGQEASIRALHLVLAARSLSLEPESFSPALLEILDRHAERVRPTTHYAIGQATNHATSEAAALYILGDVLATAIDAGCRWGRRARSRRWAVACRREGRRILEQSVRALFLADGTFAQYSLTYHRVALDTLCLAECWRRDRGDRPFSEHFYVQAAAASRWYRRLIDPDTGDGPNLGANDGAQLFNLGREPFREFRPSAQLAARLFEHMAVYADHEHGLSRLFDRAIAAAGEVRRAEVASAEPRSLGMLTEAGDRLIIRLPQLAYRPNHADLLHIDFWSGGENLLRDGGSFSYAASDERHRYYTSVRAHNVAEFDGDDPMPRLGRFLFGEWPRGEWSIEALDKARIRAGYRDYRGMSHTREIVRESSTWIVRDELNGSFRSALLRWRLAPDEWRVNGSSVVGSRAMLEFESGRPFSLSLHETTESRFYLDEQPVPEIRIALDGNAVVTMRIRTSVSRIGHGGAS